MAKRIGSLALVALAALAALPSPARAFGFDERLKRGDEGRAVRALQVRLAGWFPGERKETFGIDGSFGPQTTRTVEEFERRHGLGVDGVADPKVFELLQKLQDEDGSTAHFDWSEFVQNKNPNCSAKANAYAGTFKGGMVAPKRTRSYVRRLMWRLEALREKGGKKAIGINSGFRSVAYNDCIGGARVSQHMYGTAADTRMVDVTNTRQRRIARRTQFHGVGCYSTTTHNHLDTRIDNADLPSARIWWWPERDSQGRELDDGGRPCWGQTTTKATSSSARIVDGAASSLVPTADEIARFGRAGESWLAGAD